MSKTATPPPKADPTPPPPPPPTPEVKAVEVPVVIPDGANEAGVQPPSHVGTCLDCNRGVAAPEEGE